MSKAELELVVIDAIRQHRCLMEADQVVYEEWERSSEDPCVPLEQVEKLEAECLRRQKLTAEQQDTLSELLDILGYIPEVPDLS